MDKQTNVRTKTFPVMMNIYEIVFHVDRYNHPWIHVGSPDISGLKNVEKEYQLDAEQITLIERTLFSAN